MKKIFKSTVLALVSIFSLNTNAQSKKKSTNSLLWEVSGNGLSKPSYLFGTVHMICEKDFVMKQKVTNAFSKAEKLVLEINMADPNEMTTMQQMALGKEPLSKKLSKEQIVRLEKILKDAAGMSVSQVDNFTMQTILSLVSIKTFGCQNLKLYEMEFIEQAKNKNLPIEGLEKVSEQLETLSKSFSDDEMLSYLEKNSTDLTSKLVSIYLNEDLDALFQFTTDKEMMSENSANWMLKNRNENWIKVMPEMMKRESVFFAVGAAHLGGEIGVINLLRKAGYTIKPIVE
ncbi:MAG: TraB/GumN family protein [Limnohabitans sp.]|nr:TraB/GumN family protein [Limnohabitans sp.]